MSWICDDDTLALIRLYSLQNSLEYDGQGKPGSVMGRIMAERPDLRQYGSEISKIINGEVQKANEFALSEGLEKVREILEEEAPHLLEKRKTERKEGLPDLDCASEANVVLRFAPNPNGPLSYGHGRGVVINSEYAKKYNGELILRFDDTDTSKKPPLLEAYSQICDEVEWLSGFPPHRVIYASDRVEEYYGFAHKMLASGDAYVCRCSAEEFKIYREEKQECPCRQNPFEENLELWNQMKLQDSIPGSAVVRVKTDMTLKNPALRDWPAFRIQDTTKHPHPRPEIGSKYRVWPLLDFQSAIEDHLQGVTHIIRGKDLMDSTRKQTLLYEKLGWEYPETLYWGRVKIHEFGGFSTSQMRADIDEGHYTGWDDPRLPTLGALRRRGYDPSAIRKFWIDLGLTQKDIAVPMSTLNSLNAKAVDPDAPRLSFVRDPHTVILDTNSETPDKITLPVHPENPEKGVREWHLENGVIKVKIAGDDWIKHWPKRLKDFADIGIKNEKTEREWEGEIIRYERLDETPIVHWLPENMAQPAVLLLEENGGLVTANGLLEVNDYPDGTVVQLERMGFAILEGFTDDGSRRLVQLHG